MRHLILILRACIFFVGYSLLTLWFSFTGVLFFKFAPYRIRFAYVTLWNHLTLRWAALICGVRWRVRGLENLPATPVVFMAKHQSPWETFFLQVLRPSIATILKKELLQVPFFGWGLAMTEPIAIDRGNPKQALRAILDGGVHRIGKGRSMLIFPEGTRVAPGQIGNYARSGAMLACKAGVPIVPIAHNAGVFWPSKKFLKYPGVIDVVIGAPIDTSSGDSRALTEQVKAWIENEVAQMAAQPQLAPTNRSA